MELVLATRNAHKVLEVSRMLAPYGLTVVPLPDSVVLPPEDGESFEANALPKARAAAAALGVPVIADDSGIESAALGGRPGVRSARFAGEHASDAENLEKLLAQAPPRVSCVARPGARRVRGRRLWKFAGFLGGLPGPPGGGPGGFRRLRLRPRLHPRRPLRRPHHGRAHRSLKGRAISHRGKALRAFAEVVRLR